MDERRIKIFKTFEEQEAYHLEWMVKSTPKERFAFLLRMQQFTNRFHKQASRKRNIILHHGYSK